MKRNLELPLALGAVGLTAIGAASGCTPEKEAQAKRMNIVYIMCDDHSYQTISAYGSPVSRLAPTPNIDRLASMGKSGAEPKKWRNTLYYHFYDHTAEHNVMRHDGIFDKRYKLIHFYDETGNIPSYSEFFDLKEDPNELHNLIDDPKYKSTIDKLQKKLSDTRAEVGVTEF